MFSLPTPESDGQFKLKTNVGSLPRTELLFLFICSLHLTAVPTFVSLEHLLFHTSFVFSVLIFLFCETLLFYFCLPPVPPHLLQSFHIRFTTAIRLPPCSPAASSPLLADNHYITIMYAERFALSDSGARIV